jgi:hypothetical protein
MKPRETPTNIPSQRSYRGGGGTRREISPFPPSSGIIGEYRARERREGDKW